MLAIGRKKGAFLFFSILSFFSLTGSGRQPNMSEILLIGLFNTNKLLHLNIIYIYFSMGLTNWASTNQHPRISAYVTLSGRQPDMSKILLTGLFNTNKILRLNIIYIFNQWA